MAESQTTYTKPSSEAYNTLQKAVFASEKMKTSTKEAKRAVIAEIWSSLKQSDNFNHDLHVKLKEYKASSTNNTNMKKQSIRHQIKASSTKHKVTYTTNCIKKCLQKNEQIGKVKANASQTVIKFMELITNDILNKCNDVINEKNANKSHGSDPPSNLNVVALEKKTSKNKNKNVNNLENLITIDVLHSAINNDNRLLFIDNIITKHFPQMDEKMNEKKEIKNEELKQKNNRKKKRKFSEINEDNDYRNDNNSTKKKRKKKGKKKTKHRKEKKEKKEKKVKKNKENRADGYIDDSNKKFSFENVFGF